LIGWKFRSGIGFDGLRWGVMSDKQMM